MYTSVWEVCLAWVFRPLLQVQIEQLLLKCNFHTHTRVYSIFLTPEVGQWVRFWFLPSSACSKEMADMIMVVDMGEVVNKAIKITIQMKFNVQEELDRNYGMDDLCRTFWNILEMFSHFLSWDRDKSVWHNTSTSHRTGVMGERGEKYFPMGERLHSSNSQREIELQLSEKANLILPLIKT